ncbi:hypothetical protein AWB71_02788 [Caballeronia peredens]|nr:hypothetical protein AWB71_02788 [Caballeronia peredens]
MHGNRAAMAGARMSARECVIIAKRTRAPSGGHTADVGAIIDPGVAGSIEFHRQG